MKYHITNIKLLTKDYAIEDGEVKVEGGKIVGAGKGLPRDRNAVPIDGRGNLLMPGLKNCHTHSGMTLLRGYAEDLPLNAWLFERVFPFENKLTEEDVYWGF